MNDANQPNGIERIATERMRQIEEEGWNRQHDADHVMGELGRVGALYAMPDFFRERVFKHLWPFSWSRAWWKPSPENRIRELEKAGALIAAEIDRLIALDA